MSGKKHSEEHSGEKVPIWIISFADMITLLMSFFVMLQTMASTRDCTLFGASRDSFRRAINGLGIPDILFGKESGIKREFKKIKYPTEESTTDIVRPDRIIDADDEKIRKLFKDINDQMQVRTSNAEESLINAVAAPSCFVQGSDAITEEGLAFLKSYVGNVKQTQLKPADVKIYVIGLAAEPMLPRDQWMLSARRASVVEARIRDLLESSPLDTAKGGAAGGQGKWDIHAWGAGSSGRYASLAAGTSSSVIIAVMGAKQHGG